MDFKLKDLVLLTDSYPHIDEVYLEDELKITSNNYNRIFIFSGLLPNHNSINCMMPINATLISYKKQSGCFNLFKTLFQIGLLPIVKEIFYIITSISYKEWFLALKIMYASIIKATSIIKDIEALISTYSLENKNTVYYSYWHDHKALALSILKSKKKIKAISRSHGWDNFKERHYPKYLPMKKFIIQNLNKTYPISIAGKDEFLKYKIDSFKVDVSRLGKLNSRPIIDKKTTDKIVIVSCSNLISLKRVNLIIEVISRLNIQNVKWVHFGDGPLKNELEKRAVQSLNKLSFEFKGIVPNNQILDYYSENFIDLFINLSEYEGIPVTIMEALSAGIPVVATNVGGTGEAVNKENGFLIDKDFDIGLVSSLIEQYLSLPIEQQKLFRNNAHQYWCENFDASLNYSIFANKISSL